MPPVNTMITTTATTDAMPQPMVKRPGIEIVYKPSDGNAAVTYTVEPHPPTPRDSK